MIIPAYNEEKNIGNVLKRIPKFVDEIIVVDDGSTDGTSIIAENFGAEVVKLERNSGKGVALREGIKIAKGEIVVFLDADGQHDPQEIPKLIEPIVTNRADFVIGRRVIKAGKRPIIRKISNFITTTLVRIKTGIKIEDSQSGFRAIKREFLPDIESQRYEVETEVLLKAIKRGARISEVEVSTRYDVETGHFRIIDIFRFLLALFKY
ncbi:hypothetical protein PNA2_0182 [Pyrococcus sp. NA2]|nr:hypothetical protein PNA2_0182 [Pyrococcus sp. NA2]